jgi:hypothetical protein
MDEDLKEGLGCFGKGLIVLLLVAVVGFGLIVGMCGGFR